MSEQILIELAKLDGVGVMVLSVFLVLSSFIIMLRSIKQRDRENNETHRYVADTMSQALKALRDVIVDFRVSNEKSHAKIEKTQDQIIDILRNNN